MLEKNDESKIEKIMTKVVGNALEDVVLPRLQSIEDKQEKHDEDIEFIKDSSVRIELRLDAEFDRNDYKMLFSRK